MTDAFDTHTDGRISLCVSFLLLCVIELFNNFYIFLGILISLVWYINIFFLNIVRFMHWSFLLWSKKYQNMKNMEDKLDNFYSVLFK
jgi:hypothetical protein